MKSNIVIATNDLGRGGKERQIYFLTKYLAKDNFNVVLLLRRNIIAYEFEEIKDVVILISPSSKLIKFIKYYSNIIREYKPSIVHSWESIVTLVSLFLKPFYKYKLINGEIRYARSIKYFSLEGMITRINTKLSDYNIANSRAGLRAFRLKENQKNLVIHNGYDYHSIEIKQKNELSTPIKIGCIANFNMQKDHKTIINGCINLIKKGYDIECHFVGDGPTMKSIINEIPIDVKDKFIFWGQQNNISVLLSVFDIAVLLSSPGHSEGMSNALMEYMIAGLPIIATNTGGNKELIINKYNGILIEHANKNQFEDNIITFIKDEKTRKKLGKNAAKYAKENFSIIEMVKKYNKVYQKLNTV